MPGLLILSSAFLAAAGNGISLVAFPWLVLQRTGSATEASIVAGAGTLPLLFATLVAGTAVDFLGRRRVAMLADAMSALSVAAIPVLVLTLGAGVLNTAVLAGLAALGAFFDPAGMTARLSMLPEAARRANWTLDRANSVYEAAFNLAYITGPGIGGLLIATLGGVNTMWVTAAAFILSILAMAVLRLHGADRPEPEDRPEGVVSGVLEGLRFVWRNRVLRTLGLIELAVTGLYLPMESVLFPKYFSDRNEPAQLGWVLMALSIGGLIGALSWTVLSRIARKRTTVLTAVATFGTGATIIAFLPPLPVILVLVGRHRAGVRTHRPDLQLGDADPNAQPDARPGGRGDDIDGLRRGPGRLHHRRPAGGRLRAHDGIPGAGAAGAADRHHLCVGAGAAGAGPGSGRRLSAAHFHRLAVPVLFRHRHTRLRRRFGVPSGRPPGSAPGLRLTP